jgi:Protein of unknown function (DUF3577)
MTIVKSKSTSTSVSTTATSRAVSYFDLHVSGIGYLSRIRTAGKGSNTFLCCTINALRGKSDEVEYTKFDLIVRGNTANEIVQMLEADVNAKRKVIVSFKASDIYPESYVIKSGEQAGKTALNIKGRLLQINSAKVNGVAIILPADTADNADTSTLADPATAATDEQSDAAPAVDTQPADTFETA